jgi:hypothetical protein
LSLLFTVFVGFVFFAGTSTTNKPNEELKPGQATMISKPIEMVAPSPKTAYPGSDIMLDDENIQIILEEATEEIHDAEMSQLAVESKEIDTVTSKITNHLRIGIGKLFGNTLSNDEMEAVATQVQTQLTNEAQAKLRTRADIITNNAISSIEDKVSDEEDNDLSEAEIEKGVLNDQKKAVRDIKYGIDAEFNAVQKVLPSRAIEIEKAILEERLSTKLGKRVKLVIDEDNEVAPPDSDDELFSGLNSFNKKTATSSLSGDSNGYTGSSSSTALSNMHDQSVVSASHTSSAFPSSLDSSKSIESNAVKGSLSETTISTTGGSNNTNETETSIENDSAIDVAPTPASTSVVNNNNNNKKRKKKSLKIDGKNI